MYKLSLETSFTSEVDAGAHRSPMHGRAAPPGHTLKKVVVP